MGTLGEVFGHILLAQSRLFHEKTATSMHFYTLFMFFAVSVVFLAFGIDIWRNFGEKTTKKTCKLSMHHSKQSIEKSMQN